MHQLPRPSPRSTTPASDPTTNPERTNNPRDRTNSDLASYTDKATSAVSNRSDGAPSSHQERELTKLNQIIMNFHTKAVAMICSSRANLPRITTPDGQVKQNRWFSIPTDETEVLTEDLREWKRLDLVEDGPRPLVVEIYLDTAHLTTNQVLVINDEMGRRFNVANALTSSQRASPHVTKSGGRHFEIVLERWTIELGSTQGYSKDELDEVLPNVYKKGVVLFRSLFTLLRLMPAFKLYRKLLRQTGSHHALKLKFRIRKGYGSAKGQADPLTIPLCPPEHAEDDVVQHYAFQPLITPAGPLCCSVTYRTNCSFSVADGEELISDQLQGLDERISAPLVGRSLPDEHGDRQRSQYSSTLAPTTARERPRAVYQAYGSLGTFHDPNRRGSPVSELRQRALQDDEDGDGRRAETSKRTSVDYVANPPFKAGSLTSSPRPLISPGTSYGRNESSLARHGVSLGTSYSKRTSLNALPQQQLRTPSLASEIAVGSSGSSSPKPAPGRYSSSFANRPRRFTSQSGKTGESNVSSGRGSSDSKEKAEQFAEMVEGSIGSARTDDDDIASFISELEKSKDIKFHSPPGSAREKVVNLTKFSSTRDTSTQLSEEMSSSSLIQTSSTPPSRRLSNVPGLSTSSSPGRAFAHVPHVRSRLSTHSVAEQDASGTSALSGEGSASSPRVREVEEEDDDEPFIFPHHRDDNLD